MDIDTVSKPAPAAEGKASRPGYATRLWQGWLAFVDSDLCYNFRTSRLTVVATAVLALLLFAGICAPLLSHYNPFDMAAFDLMDSELPPAWVESGEARFWLGTDIQGRDVYSLILYGLRVSLIVGFISVLCAMALGVTLGVVSGYFGGTVDALIMRLADAMLSFPTIMFALLVSGAARGLLPQEMHEQMAVYIIVISITLTGWMQYARTVRGCTLLEGHKEYVQAAKVMGSGNLRIMFLHILPNVLSPVLVLATLHLALAVLTEATLSFLGVGMPPNQPSLGTLINEGNKYLFSGQWWVVVFPSLVLVVLALSVNLVGDWLRDALNPKLR
ncbi:ABC transporter permease [Zobellella denitrificans]|jgi:peptide/nickel transport system permease protein|uniref:ABC transporter permease n=1 Tax=Zobellella denitrificans TaxID=347534 RepID=UPI000B8BF43D|nr:ABC transporter permease [Zobellella denitrificans]OXS16748.1 ABC transporter permease [Zobellella denitrificans]